MKLYLTAWKDSSMLPAGFVKDEASANGMKPELILQQLDLALALLDSVGISVSYDTKPGVFVEYEGDVTSRYRKFQEPTDGYCEVED